jgi:ubiquinone/menaquinone biosynthesis C-methylase UbiE
MDRLNQRKWDRAAINYDLLSRGPEKRWAPWKREFFAPMSGRVLFLAAGTGLDFQFFPEGRRVTAIDISRNMIDQARPRAALYDGSIELLHADALRLSFGNGVFDQVFTSCTFCSVPDPVQGLRELRRVLKPGGELRMFEHTGSRWFPFSLMLNLMTPLTSRFGPEMNRDTPLNVLRAGFRIRRVENLYLDVVKTILAV